MLKQTLFLQKFILKCTPRQHSIPTVVAGDAKTGVGWGHHCPRPQGQLPLPDFLFPQRPGPSPGGGPPVASLSALACLLLLFLLLLERLVFSIAVASPRLPQGLLATFVADRAPAPPWTLPPGPNECLFSDERRSFGAGWVTRGLVTAQRRSRSFGAAAGALPLCALLAYTRPHRIVSASSVLAWPERCWGASPTCSLPTGQTPGAPCGCCWQLGPHPSSAARCPRTDTAHRVRPKGVPVPFPLERRSKH